MQAFRSVGKDFHELSPVLRTQLDHRGFETIVSRFNTQLMCALSKLLAEVVPLRRVVAVRSRDSHHESRFLLCVANRDHQWLGLRLSLLELHEKRGDETTGWHEGSSFLPCRPT